MGTVILTVKGEIESVHQKLDKGKEAEEQLAVLEKMAKAQLLSKFSEILHEIIASIDYETHDGVVVAEHQDLAADKRSMESKGVYLQGDS